MKKQLLFAALSAVCALATAGNLVVSVLDKEGKPVQDAVVVVIPFNKAVLPKNPLPMQATITQEKMQFIPAVTLVPVGAKVRFVNNDPWDHHVRSSPAGMGQFNATNIGFELRLEGKSEGKPAKFSDVTLDKSGVLGATLLGCFIHGSMRGYVYASESPWAVKTNAEGLANFEDLPDGAAQVKVWQADQIVDVSPQQATIGATAAKNVIQLSVVPRRRRI
ncbi:MAG: plastocyanin [Polaromonas sp.]|uniref:cupredoxin domain-containing protein n=1 Tax=Polaromonas sp. TaxID=1869339 RepID=UPI0017F9491C|nr:plastocyanin [Polaromonas sp.]NMM10743.1 plastocyanin [Polaromonas sp.]